MHWLPPEIWEPLKRGEHCPMCADMHLDENPHSYLVAELSQSFVRLPRNQYLRGWTIVACKRHVSELFELQPDELGAFWRDVTQVAQALERLYRPAKLNYGLFGNVCPHLHCHLLVQSYQDDPEKPINMHEQEVLLAAHEYQAMIQELRALLVGQPE